MVQFAAVDYGVLVFILGVSLAIGIFFARKRQDSREYTSGKGKLGVIPVGLSMTVSYISAITVQVRHSLTLVTSSSPALPCKYNTLTW